MKKILLFMGIVVATTTFTLAQNNNIAVNANIVPDELIIKFKSTGTPISYQGGQHGNAGTFGITAIDKLNAKYDLISATKVFPDNRNNPHPARLRDVYTLKFGTTQNVSALIEEYMATGVLEYAEADHIGRLDATKNTSQNTITDRAQNTSVVPNDKYFNRSWGEYNNGTFSKAPHTAVSGADIKMECGWGVTMGDTNTIVAVLDDGTQLNHPEFAGRIWRNYGDIMAHTAKGWVGNGKDDEGDGYVDDWRGWNFVYNDTILADPVPTSNNSGGHGTNVMGIVGATGNNSIGYAGVNWQCKLMSLTVIDSVNGGAQSSQVASAITYAADHNAKIISLSLGFVNDDSAQDNTFQSAIDYAYSKGSLTVASMGNNNNNTVQAPADMTHVMAVGASTVNDQRAVPLGSEAGSNYNTYISVIAPGDWIYGLNNKLPDNYQSSWDGTSQSTPFVTGLASLMLAVKPSLTPLQLKTLIQETADKGTGAANGDKTYDTPISFNQYYGYGRINACRALDTLSTIILTGTDNVSNNNPSVSLYPNPFSNKATLVFTNIGKAGDVTTITIYDIQGREIKQLTTQQQQVDISRDGMSSGLYFYMITSGENIVGKGKFIVSD